MHRFRVTGGNHQIGESWFIVFGPLALPVGAEFDLAEEHLYWIPPDAINNGFIEAVGQTADYEPFYDLILDSEMEW
jgi:hypothetical protein